MNAVLRLYEVNSEVSANINRFFINKFSVFLLNQLSGYFECVSRNCQVLLPVLSLAPK